MWEVETLFFWNRNKREEEYIHIIRYFEAYNEKDTDDWEGKIKSLKRKIYKCKESMEEKMDKLGKNMEEKMSK